MKVIIVKNGSLSLVLEPEDDIDKETLRQLNGATISPMNDAHQILGRRIEGGSIISSQSLKPSSHEDQELKSFNGNAG